ncbi:hypothetical protein [Sporosarcina sp. UB5]|uniref:hypothetical protein n=1 Tax=Sporosarcina sp. UB5 TaxID=3047463 RepID=UPI003D7A505E
MREFWDLCVSDGGYARVLGFMRFWERLCVSFGIYAFLVAVMREFWDLCVSGGGYA